MRNAHGRAVPHLVLQLQRIVRNQALQRLMRLDRGRTSRTGLYVQVGGYGDVEFVKKSPSRGRL